MVDDQVLDAAPPAVGPVQAVVGVAGEHQMLGADRAAEELHAIVQIVVDLDVIHFGAGTHALEGDAVQLVLRVHVGAGVLDHDIVQDAAAVVGVVAAEQAGVGLALLGALGGAAVGPFQAIVDRGVAVDHQAAPFAAGAGDVRLPCQVGEAGQGDRRGAGAVGDDLGASGNHQEVQFGAAVDGGSSLYGQAGGSLVVAADDHLAHQLVEVVAGQQQVAGDGAGQLADPHVVQGAAGDPGAVRAAEVRLPGLADGVAVGPAGGPVLGAEGADVVGVVEEGVAEAHWRHPGAVLRHIGGAVQVRLHGAVVVPVMGLGAGEADAFDGQVGAEQVAAGAVHPQAALGTVDEAVAQRQAGAAADAQGALVGLAEQAHVGDGRVGAGPGAFVAFAVVRLNGVVGGIGLLDVEVLDAPSPAVRPVQ